MMCIAWHLGKGVSGCQAVQSMSFHCVHRLFLLFMRHTEPDGKNSSKLQC